MEFSYIASTPKGEVKKETIIAKNKEQAAQKIREKGLMIVSIKELKTKRLLNLGGIFSFFKNRVRHIDLVMFTKHLSVMIKAGLTLNEGLEILVEQTESYRLKIILRRIVKELEKGQRLSVVLEKYPKVFSELYINMVRVGESSGTLEENLEYLADQMKKDYELLAKIKSAMTYPIVVLTATIGLGIGLSIYVLPKIVGLFSGFEDARLPLSTRALLAFTSVMQKYGIFIVIAAAGLIMFLIWLSRKDFVKPYSHKIILKIPIIGKIAQNLNLARFCRTLGSLLKSGLVINESLGISSRTLGNILFKNALIEVLIKVEKGNPMSQNMERFPHLFPPILTRMTDVGERVGNLDGVLIYLAEFYEAEVDSTTQNLTATIEPILLVVIGAAVGIVAVSIISPIYNLAGSVGK